MINLHPYQILLGQLYDSLYDIEQKSEDKLILRSALDDHAYTYIESEQEKYINRIPGCIGVFRGSSKNAMYGIIDILIKLNDVEAIISLWEDPKDHIFYIGPHKIRRKGKFQFSNFNVNTVETELLDELLKITEDAKKSIADFSHKRLDLMLGDTPLKTSISSIQSHYQGEGIFWHSV